MQENQALSPDMLMLTFRFSKWLLWYVNTGIWLSWCEIRKLIHIINETPQLYVFSVSVHSSIFMTSQRVSKTAIRVLINIL